jgi:hypothetical protein
LSRKQFETKASIEVAPEVEPEMRTAALFSAAASSTGVVET